MGSFAAGDTDYIPKLNALQDAALVFSIQGANFNAAHANGYYISANSVTATLPASPAAGNRIVFRSPLAGVTGFTVGRNGNNINSAAADHSPAEGNFLLECVYVDATVGWQIRDLKVPTDVAPNVAFSVKTAGFTAAKNNFYAIDASSFTVTLPTSPTAGDRLWLAATTPARTAITLGRAGSNINSAAADYVINGRQWAAEVRYIDSTVGWLVITMATDQALARWDATTKQLRYHDGQRELAAPVGWAPYAMSLGRVASSAINATATLAASGGSVAFPVLVPSHLLLESVTFRNGDTTLDRSLEWRLYVQRLNDGNSGENALDEVTGANGTLSFTASAASWQTSTPAGAPIYLAPGVYWLVARNTHGSNSFGLTGETMSNAFGNLVQTKTLGSSLGSTLDFVAATWTKGTNIPAAFLSGRVFGQTAAF